MQSTQAVHTVLQKLVIRQERDSDKVLKNRQKTAFAPNYVHSLDSTHMMLTALACKEEGVAFAGVHGSFWTHAGDTRRLAQLLRETFVELHSQPLLEQLLAEFQEQHPKLTFPPIPDKGDLDITSVLNSDYFFS